MESKNQMAVVLKEYGKKPEIKEDFPRPNLNEGELLIKVQGSTINPSDRLFMQGLYQKRSLPTVCGIEGTGKVVEARGQAVQTWIGKRVSFISSSGSWSQFAVSRPELTFEIDQDVPMSSACSGVVNPLTAIAFIEIFKQSGCKGIIMTAAASCLGIMVHRLCMKEKIPLLSIVRNTEEAERLKKQGAMNVLVTEGSWEKEFKSHVEKSGCNFVLDALGGGPVTETLITNLGPKSKYYMIANLQKKPLHIQNPSILYSGVNISGFLLQPWWDQTNDQVKKKIRSEYSNLLKNQLKTYTSKEFPMKNICEAIEMSESKPHGGKVMIRMG